MAVGTLAGLLGSLAGMGGGFVMIPLLTSPRVGLGLTQHAAHGTSLFAVAATGLAGAASYGGLFDGGVNGDDGSGKGNTTTDTTDTTNNTTNTTKVVQYPEAAAVALTAIFTARWGAQAEARLSGRHLQRALGWLMLAVAPLVPANAYYLQQSLSYNNEKRWLQQQQQQQNKDWSKYAREHLLVPSLIGVGSGFLAGLFGVGGGTIVVPALVIGTDMNYHQALATSLAAMIVPAVSGTWTHYRAGNCAMAVAPGLAAGALLGAALGAQLALHTNETWLRWGFSGLLATLGVRTLLRV